MQGGSLTRRFGSLSSESLTLDSLEVAERVSKLAAGIRNKLNHKDDSYIPVFIDYSLESQLFILAMASSGYNFALLDPTMPSVLLEKQIQQLNAKVGVSSSGAIELIASKSLESIFRIEDLYNPSTDPDISKVVEAGSVVIFSSGSTGHPKGIVIPWLEIDEWTQIRLQAAGASSVDAGRILNLSPLSWSVGVINTLCVQFGTELHTSDPLRYSPQQLLARIQEVDPNYLLLTGHLATALGRAAETSKHLYLSSLSHIHFGSSSIRWETINQFKAIVPPDATVTHVYAASEAMRPFTFKSPLSEIPAFGPVPIGVPRDPKNLLLLPYGEDTFEIVVSGNIASGYLDKTLTDEKFVKDENGKIWWSSGDLAKIDQVSGQHYFAGRKDDFVKINDHNVSLIDVDDALKTHPDIRNSVSIAIESSGRNRIISFIQSSSTSGLNQAQISRYLRAKLPSYSLPQAVLLIDALPQTRSGKPDVAKLREIATIQLSAQQTTALET
jgi:acyl-coenzyme A synthetase/AMP-(fatty) acid ligase